MANCECLPACPFFNDKMPTEGGLGKIYKNKYCLGSNEICARYKVFKKFGKGTVPLNLYPNMTERADNIISGKEPHA